MTSTPAIKTTGLTKAYSGTEVLHLRGPRDPRSARCRSPRNVMVANDLVVTEG
jgi:hypothetical protein